MAQQPKRNSLQETYRAVHWDVDDGLSDPVVGFYLKDLNGFIWMSTNYGLNRFDGHTFKNYFAAKNSRETINDNYTLRLIEDSLHNIWIGTTKGMSRYDIKADTFSHFLPNPDMSISEPSITPFFAIHDNVYCIEGSSLITVYNTHSLVKKTLLKLSPGEYVGYNMSILYSVFDAGSNSVWMLEGDIGNPGGGLLQISLSDGKRKHYTWPCFRNIPHHSHCSEGMCYDRERNCIWINSPDGLVEFALGDKEFRHIDALKEFVKLKNYERGTVGIDMDTKGRIWFSTRPKGILIYDPSTESVSLPFANDSLLQQDISHTNISIYCDRDNIVWSGSWLKRGIYQITPFIPAVQRYTAAPGKPDSLSNSEVLNCINGEAGQMWMGTRDGLNIFDTRTGKFELLRPKNLQIKKERFTLPFAVNTSANKAWLLSDSLYEMDLRSRKCRAVTFKDLAGNTLKKVGLIYSVPYKGGCMVQGTYSNQAGIFILNPDSIVAHQILALPSDELSMFDVVTDDRFLFLLDPKTNHILTYAPQNGKWIRIVTPLDSINGTKIICDIKDQTYWLISDRQLLQYNKNFQAIYRYQVDKDIPCNVIFSVIRDNQDNIWFNTDRAIFRLSPHTRRLVMLTERDGFQKQNFNVCITPVSKDVNGDLYFPCGAYFGKGFDRVSPDKLREDYPPSIVYLQSLEINQKSFSTATGYGGLKKLSLRYFQNKIAIETGTIDYYSKGKSRIRYKLEGRNNEWQYAPDYYTIRYEALPTGNYTLLLQASNAVGDFNGPVKRLLISIAPAFWATWWFRVSSVLCLIALIYGLIRWRLNLRFHLQLDRSQKEKQIAQLQKQKIELEMQALRAQMNPHFIFNALSSINNFILSNDRAKASEYLTVFSRLVRLILQNSQTPFILLESELETLKLYVELEAVRFNHHFDFKIEVEEDLDTAAIKIPSLIIQPYVENAIWHGLMHKAEGGRLTVEIFQEEDRLCCKITDNGIGRSAAAKQKSKSAFAHKSMGLQITANRIAKLSQDADGTSQIIIKDIVRPDGKAAGTEVLIKIPLQYA